MGDARCAKIDICRFIGDIKDLDTGPTPRGSVNDLSSPSGSSVTSVTPVTAVRRAGIVAATMDESKPPETPIRIEGYREDHAATTFWIVRRRTSAWCALSDEVLGWM
jgi:hypothetical protein